MPRTGRPREFVMDEALDAAMMLFWRYGYEATSVTALRDATGLSSASFYAAFGSKQGLFEAVLARYNATHGSVTDSVYDHELAPRAAVERMLRDSAAMQTDPGHPLGCLVVLSATTTAPANEAVRAVLARQRADVRAALEACIARGVATGELTSETNTDGLAVAIESFMWGLSTEARDGLSAGRLDGAVDQVLRLWDLNRAARR